MKTDYDYTALASAAEELARATALIIEWEKAHDRVLTLYALGGFTWEQIQTVMHENGGDYEI